MIERVNALEELGAIIKREEPRTVLYDLGEGEERTELLVTSIDGDSRATNRIASSPQVTLYRSNSRTLMDITDSDKDADRYSYRNLKPQGTVFEPSTLTEEPNDELGDLVIELEGNRQLAISQYRRSA
jgi:hypothetical protein